MARMGVVANIQPSFVVTDAAFARQRLPEGVQQYSYIWKTLLDRGVRCAGGSDAPVETCRPLQGIHDAIYRRGDASCEDSVYHPDQCLTLAQAIDLYTQGGAYAAGREDRSGLIREGYDADLVVIDPSLLTDTALLAKGAVQQLWVAGEKKYDAAEAAEGGAEAGDQVERVLGGPYQPGKNGPRTPLAVWAAPKLPHGLICGGRCQVVACWQPPPVLCMLCAEDGPWEGGA